MHELVALSDQLHIFLADRAAAGRSNSGVIVDDDGITIVDALISPAAARPLLDFAATTGLPVRRLVLTSSHVPFSGGSGVFALPAIYGSGQVSAHMDQPIDPASCAQMFPDHGPDLVELDEITTRVVTHTVAEGAWLSPTAVVAPTSGELDENLVVQVPEMRLVFAGAMASFGVTPMAGGGDPARWADALDTLLEWGEIIVPGHGPIGGEEEVRDLQAYLRACVGANGDVAALGEGPWDTWTDRRFDRINVERAAMLAAGDPSPPPSLLTALGLG